VTNALAYYDRELDAAVKSFIVQDHGANVINYKHP